jgi:hypothetical protein
MKSFNIIKEALDNILQKDIEIVFNNKVIRKGVFILYSIKDYHLTVIIKTPKNNKTYDILYPFNVEVHGESRIVMDYRLDNIQIENQRLIDCISRIDTTGASKFLNHELHINIK